MHRGPCGVGYSIVLFFPYAPPDLKGTLVDLKDTVSVFFTPTLLPSSQEGGLQWRPDEPGKEVAHRRKAMTVTLQPSPLTPSQMAKYRYVPSQCY